MSEDATSVNKQLSRRLAMLSSRGQRAYFPKKGTIGQAADAKECKINATLGIAREDDGSPMVLPAVLDAMNASTFLPEDVLYAPSAGMQDLRDFWKHRLYASHPSLDTLISTPVVTNGLTHGLRLANDLFVDPGDPVLVSDLYWANYARTFDSADFVTFPTGREKFNVVGLREQLLLPGDKKIVLVNNWNNPTGIGLQRDCLAHITDSCFVAAEEGKQVIVVCDDAYAGFVYDQEVISESLFAHLADLHENVMAVKVDGLSKEAFGFGLRVGFITYGSKALTVDEAVALEDKTAGLIRGMISNVSRNNQKIALTALQHPDFDTQFASKVSVLRERYEHIRTLFSEHEEYKKQFVPLHSNSGYFMCVDFPEKSAEDCERIRKTLIEHYSTGIIVWGTTARIACSVVNKEQLTDLFSNLYTVCEQLS